MSGIDNDFGGSADIPAENQRVAMVPPSQVAPKTASQVAWEEALIGEASSRIRWRTWLFRGVAAATAVLFSVFLFYLYWVHQCPARKVDHLLMWLLAVMPVGLVFVLIKLTSDPIKDTPSTMWPEQLVKVGEKIVDHAADILKKKFG